MDDVSHMMNWQDAIALGFFILCWLGYSRFSEHKSNSNNLLSAINNYRLNWMREMMGRENRSLDAITVGNLTRSFTFFASTTMFILAALVSMLGYRDKANAIISEIPFAKLSDPALWQIKLLLLIYIFAYAFFKYTWSMRQYNYVSIFIGSAPDYRDRKDEHEQWAQRGAALTGNAARHFNNGLRAYYFGMAAVAWFVHPYLFIAATATVVYETYRREYRSGTLRILTK